MWEVTGTLGMKVVFGVWSVSCFRFFLSRDTMGRKDLTGKLAYPGSTEA